jgi:hypothetical protein
MLHRMFQGTELLYVPQFRSYFFVPQTKKSNLQRFLGIMMLAKFLIDNALSLIGFINWNRQGTLRNLLNLSVLFFLWRLLLQQLPIMC